MTEEEKVLYELARLEGINRKLMEMYKMYGCSIQEDRFDLNFRRIIRGDEK